MLSTCITKGPVMTAKQIPLDVSLVEDKG